MAESEGGGEADDDKQEEEAIKADAGEPVVEGVEVEAAEDGEDKDKGFGEESKVGSLEAGGGGVAVDQVTC